jgi:transketolase
MIGKGAPHKQGSHESHGAPLGADEIAAAKLALDWPFAPFEIPPEVYAEWDAKESGARLQADWDAMFVRYQDEHPAAAREFQRRIAIAKGWNLAKMCA